MIIGKQNKKDNQNFERQLFQTLKSYGYLFPKNTKDVIRFEELYGNTEIDTPPLKAIDSMELDFPNSDSEFQMAAFASNSDENSDFPLDLDEEENNDLKK